MIRLLSHFKQLLTRKILLILVLFGIVVLGAYLVTGSHAASSYITAETENGTLSGPASAVTGTGASAGKAVSFAASTASAGTPMQLLNRRSDVKVYPSSAAAASDADYNTAWTPGSSGTVTYDLSAVPSANRQKVLLAWYTRTEDGYSGSVIMNGDCVAYQRPIASNYTIQLNTAPTGASPPTTGWDTAVTVSNNVYFSRQHVLDMTNSSGQAYNWVRLNITGSVSGLEMNVDLADASQGMEGDTAIMGDSITARYAGHNRYDGSAGDIGLAITDLVAAQLGNSYHMITQNLGVACSKSSDWNNTYASFSAKPTIDEQLSIFPGKYVTLNLGTNDLGGDVNQYYANMEALVKKIAAAGKVAILPKIPWPDGGYPDTTATAYNSKLDLLHTNYPKQTIPGPDLYTTLYNHASWYDNAGNVHPQGPGLIAVRCAWAYAIVKNVYNKTPTPLPACNGYAAP